MWFIATLTAQANLMLASSAIAYKINFKKSAKTQRAHALLIKLLRYLVTALGSRRKMASEIGKLFQCVVTFFYFYKAAVVAIKLPVAETADTPQQENHSQQGTSGAKRKLIFSSPSKDKVRSKIKSCSSIILESFFADPITGDLQSCRQSVCSRVSFLVTWFQVL